MAPVALVLGLISLKPVKPPAWANASDVKQNLKNVVAKGW